MDFLIWLAVIGMIALYTFQSLFTKLYTDHYPGDPDMASSVLTVVSGLSVAVITFFCFSLCQFTVNGWSILIGVLNAFAAAILRGEPLIADGREGINGLMISNAMHLSAWEDRVVELPFDEHRFYDLLMERVKTSRRKENVASVTSNTEGSYNA